MPHVEERRGSKLKMWKIACSETKEVERSVSGLVCGVQCDGSEKRGTRPKRKRNNLHQDKDVKSGPGIIINKLR